MARIFILLLLLLPCAAVAQTDDRSTLTAFLEDNMSGVGRKVTITGFAGALSSRATMTEMTIADSQGVWITLKDVVLDWNRAALFGGRVSVNALTASQIIVARAPLREAAAPGAEAPGFSLPELPISVDIDRIAADQITLAPPVLGRAVTGSLAASLSLIGGEGRAKLLLARSDGQAGQVALTASYANASGQLAIDLDAHEAAGGVVATLLGLPGAPSLDLTIKGEGPITGYNADLALASNGVARLAGRLSLQTRSNEGQRFSADLTGDLAPLFLPAYAGFFGPVVQLQIAGIRADDGRLDLNQLSVRARALVLDGALVLAADGLPEKVDLAGRLGLEGGTAVLLPLPGQGATSVTSADLTLAFDAAKGEGWQGSAAMQGLVRGGFSADSLRLSGSGQIARQAAGAAGTVLDAVLRFDAVGLAPADAAVAQALGSTLSGTAALNWQQGSGVVAVRQLALNGEGYGVAAKGTIAGLGSGYTLTGQATAQIDDLARASALAGRSLSGRGEAQVSGSGSLLGGSFDLAATLAGTDLRFGQAQLDALLRGTSRIGLSALRDAGGTRIRRLDIAARSLTARVAGQIASAGSDLTANLAFDDLSALGGGYGGALVGKAHFTGTAQAGAVTLAAQASGLTIGQPEVDRLLAGDTTLALALDVNAGQVKISTAKLTNPQLSATATGTVAGRQRQFDLAARLTNLALLLPDFPGPVTLTGSAVDDAQGTRLDLSASGPGQIAATVSGLIAPGYRQADLRIKGTAQAGLANGLISPRSVTGPLKFDLVLNGPFAPAFLSGRVALTGGRISDPGLPFALEGIGGTADLAGGRAQIAVDAGASSGGRMQITGGMALATPYDSALSVTLQNVVVKDPQLYKTTASGTVTVTGPLAGGVRIGGAIGLAATELRIPSTGLGGVGALPDLRHVNEPAAVRATRARAGLIGGGAAGGSGAGQPSLLDLTISAPNQVFIRGRGLDVELGGSLRLGGTTAAVVPSGAFNLIRGRLDILGKRLDLSEALLQLEGDFVPYLRIMASTTNDGITSSVLIEGKANEPSVHFVSTPELPEEEVLANLMFGRGLAALSPLQAVQLANAVATLAGKGGDGIVGKLRKGFGLDDLDLVTDGQGGASVKAGKYLSKNLYTEIIVDQQGQSQINLNLDLTPNVTLRGTTSTTSGSTGIGIFKEKDY